MPVLEIRKFPNAILKKTAFEVVEINGGTAGLLNNMIDTMYAANGIGLAAPQVGVLERVIAIDTDPENRGKKQLKLINPVITEREGEITTEEGCLSVVNYTAEITRAAKILLKAWTIEQRPIEIEFEGLEAVCLQHEVEHLDGTLFIDHISRLKRELYRKRLKKAGTDPAPRTGEQRPAL